MLRSLLSPILSLFHPPPEITVIIPTYNESAQIATTIRHIRRHSKKRPEILVIDANSTDKTPHLALRAGANATRTVSGGRARQLNLGASLAKAPILLFLHADTLLPTDYEAQLSSILYSRRHVAGAFRLAIDTPGWPMRVVETVANWRSTCMHAPYGDQGLFLTRRTFQRVGGYSSLPFLEDYEMVRRLGSYGRVAISSSAVVTSGRRWETLGVLQTTFLNQVIIAGYHIGVPVSRLRAWYRGALVRAERRKLQRQISLIE